MDAREKFAKYMFDKGLRLTDQRRKICNVFLATERHVSVQDLYNRVLKRHKGIGYATVSRTIKLMTDAGVCREVDFGDGISRFEHKFGHEHHDHLICTICGGFVEIYSKKLEQLQDQLVRKHGYMQQYHKLDIFGVCPRCAKKGKKE